MDGTRLLHGRCQQLPYPDMAELFPVISLQESEKWASIESQNFINVSWAVQEAQES